jgi:hypothetical protein
MDNDPIKIITCTVLFMLGASCFLLLLALMFSAPGFILSFLETL